MNDPWLVTVRREGGGIDEPEVRRALGLMVADSGFVQVQALPSARWRHLPAGDTDGLIRAVREFAGDTETGVYVSLNPFPRPLDRAVRNADVTARRWLLVDPDAVKPGGVKQSTTDAEKEASRVVTEAVRDHLRALGWPDPIYVDSGNNWQLLYRVDLPNDKLSQQLLAQCLKNLGARFNTPRVQIDRAVYDARRICKVPGTWVRKGPNAPDRPWRMARLMSVPMVLTPVPAALLQELAAAQVGTTPSVGPEPEPPPARAREPGDDDGPVPDPDPAAALESVRRSFAADPWLAKVTDRPGGEAYARAALGSACAAVASCTHNRNTLLYTESLKIATLCAAGYLDEAEARRLLTLAGTAAGLGRDGDPREVERAVANGFEYGLQHPRAVPELRGGKGKAAQPGLILPPGDGDESRPFTGKSGRVYPFQLVVRASTVVPKKVKWLWKDRFPLGFLALMAGRTGIGKTFVTLDVAARLTVGAEIPLGGGECFEPSSVMLISEDSQDFLLTPRLIEAGADTSRVFFMSLEAMAHYTLADLQMLDDTYHAAGCPKLVVIDPPTNFLGDKDEHKNAVVRGTLMGISLWCMRYELSCVMITHCNKGVKKDMEALDRIIGSIAWASTARIAHIFAPDNDKPQHGFMVTPKNNLGPPAPSIHYGIEMTPALARVSWLAVVDLSADEALSGEKRKPRGIVAVEWLAERFRERREWPSDELKRAAAEAGLSKNALWSPEAMALPIRKSQHTNAAGERYWFWTANPGWPPENLIPG